eukprot:scaffold3204_cov185-Alexandrium_tamarense.AAC.12
MATKPHPLFPYETDNLLQTSLWLNYPLISYNAKTTTHHTAELRSGGVVLFLRRIHGWTNIRGRTTGSEAFMNKADPPPNSKDNDVDQPAAKRAKFAVSSNERLKQKARKKASIHH